MCCVFLILLLRTPGVEGQEDRLQVLTITEFDMGYHIVLNSPFANAVESLKVVESVSCRTETGRVANLILAD